MSESLLGYLQLLFCGTVRQHKGNKVSKDVEGGRVKIRVGFEGKDTLFSTENLNVKNTFGHFAVLLDYASNRLVPLRSDGSVMESLEGGKRYVVVLNTHGSSSHKWEDLRKHKGGSKKHRKHGNGKHSGKKKRNSFSAKTTPSSSPAKPTGKVENNAGKSVKDTLLVQEGEEEEEEEEGEEQMQPVTNFATIDFGVSSSMDSMISHSREVYVY